MSIKAAMPKSVSDNHDRQMMGRGDGDSAAITGAIITEEDGT
jgi:hypothetical protein